MAIQYHVYENDGAGGPIDYSTPVATVSGLSWLSGTLAAGSDTSWGVRAYDTVSGLEEANLTATARVRLDAGGNDVTAVPNAPRAITTRAGAAGTAIVEWVYVAAGESAAPTGFRVWLTAGGTVNYAVSPAATVSAVGNGPIRTYSTTLSGLTDGATYSIGVRAYNATGEEPNETKATVVGSTVPPSNVTGLAGSAVTRS